LPFYLAGRRSGAADTDPACEDPRDDRGMIIPLSDTLSEPPGN
jgi:hypothetical protein